MNFSSAIQAHTNWKLRLFTACAETSTVRIDADTLAKDDQCELGKWLRGDARRYTSDARFSELVAAHAGFHRAAGDVARMIAAGKKAEAEKTLYSRDSEFTRTTMQVVALLMGFRTRHGDS